MRRSRPRPQAQAQPPRTASGRLILRRPLRVARYGIRDARWALPPLRAAFLSDFHACAPWVSLQALGRIVAQTNALAPDLILLGGDYLMDHNMHRFSRRLEPEAIVAALSGFEAPLGVHGVLGNHDWGDCPLARRTGFARNSVAEAFAAAGRPLLRNDARPIAHGSGFWLVGTDSQRAIRHANPLHFTSFCDPDAAFAAVPQGAPVIHLAHEPDYFAQRDPRALLQLSGHTHGGQIKLWGHTPVVPSDYGDRYVYGYTQEDKNHLIVSSGIGTSGLPLRLGVPPEIVLIEIRNLEE